MTVYAFPSARFTVLSYFISTASNVFTLQTARAVAMPIHAAIVFFLHYLYFPPTGFIIHSRSIRPLLDLTNSPVRQI